MKTRIASCLLSIVALSLAAVSAAQVQPTSANPFSDGARFNYSLIKGIVTGAAAAMPEASYGFRPTEGADVRTFAQFVGHLADANYRMCSIVIGQDPPMDTGLERSVTTKATLVKALADSFTYCDKVYSGMTDSAGAALVKFDAGGEGTRQGPIQVPIITALGFQVQHAFEHYGNLVTYMRMQKIVPPKSR